jgi:hypothetical protein
MRFMRSSFASTPVDKFFALSLIVSAMLLTTACAHRGIRQILPPVTLSDTRTKRNLVVGQVFSQGTNGELAAGPNLRAFGLVSHSLSLGPLTVSQPDITLGELLSAIGASSASCEASLPWQQVTHEGHDWFKKEEDTLVGEDVSFLLEDVSEEIAEPKSLGRLFREEGRRSTGKVPWMPNENSAHSRATVAVVQTLYARQAIVRFRVTERNQLPLASTYFLGRSVSTVDETILTLIKIASVCGAQAHARELPDPGVEVAVAFPAPMFMGAGLVRFVDRKAVAMTPVQTSILLYETPRLPPYSQESQLRSEESVWKVDTDAALPFLNGANSQPKLDEGSTFFKYCPAGGCNGLDCPAGGCDAIITTPHEFDPEDGSPYDQAIGCVVGKASSWWNPVGLYRGVFGRERELRELVLFFGSAPLEDVKSGYDDYTSEKVHGLQPGNVLPIPKSGPTKAVWIYEYHCEGGIAQLRRHPYGTNIGVSKHLKEWGLDKPRK